MEVKKFKRKDSYEKLIEYAYQKCNVIMFVAREDGLNYEDIKKLNKNMSLIQEKFSNSFIKELQRPLWVFHKSQKSLLNKMSDIEFNNQFHIYFYKFTNEIKAFLLSNPNLFKWLNPEYPEDISFFKNNCCWLYSIAHEEICDIYVENEKEFKELKKIGIEFYEKEYRKASENELYFENELK